MCCSREGDFSATVHSWAGRMHKIRCHAPVATNGDMSGLRGRRSRTPCSDKGALPRRCLLPHRSYDAITGTHACWVWRVACGWRRDGARQRKCVAAFVVARQDMHLMARTSTSDRGGIT